jgi:hypothetical protein
VGGSREAGDLERGSGSSDRRMGGPKGQLRRAYRPMWRGGIISVVTTVAIVVIVALPGTFAVWLKIEQSVCGVLMLGVALVANGRTARSRGAARQSARESVRSAR